MFRHVMCFRNGLSWGRRHAGFFGAGLSLLLLSTALWAAFTNGGFETGTLSGWTTLAFLNSTGVNNPVTNVASLNLAVGGNTNTVVLTGTNTSDAILGSTVPFRYARYGTHAALVNSNGSTVGVSGSGANQNANALVQTITIGASDVDPLDSQIHIRFVYAPIMQAVGTSGHTYSQEPYYFIRVLDLTKATILYQNFGSTAVTTLPWQTITPAGSGAVTVSYLNWQLVDIAPGSGISMGDQVKVEVYAAGCKQGTHMGEVYVDGFGAVIPGISVQGTANTTASAGSNIVYDLTPRNGGGTAATAVAVSFTTPPNTTFQAVAQLSGMTCTTPAVNAAGTVTCTYTAPLSAGTVGQPVAITVNVNSGATGAITTGDYSVSSTQESALAGPPIVTTLVSGTAPVCTLTPTTGTINLGDSSMLSASCTPAATSYTWTNTGFASSASSGNVSPTATTSYGVVGENGAGFGSQANATVTVNPLLDATSRTRMNATALTLNRGTGRYTGTFTVTNTGATTITGPLYVTFALPTGVTLPGLPTYGGLPYVRINLASGLAPGATSPAASLSFADPTNARISYTATRYAIGFGVTPNSAPR